MTDDSPIVGPFVGAKAAVLIDGNLLCLLRDDRPDVAFPGMWDFPGGGREGDETGFQTLTREMEEEVGLDARAGHVHWQWYGPSAHVAGQMSWFYVLELPTGAARDVLMGDEGDAWMLMTPARFLSLDDAVPSMQARLRLWMKEQTDGKIR